MDNNNSGDEYETSGVIIIFNIGAIGVDGVHDFLGGEHPPGSVGGKTGAGVGRIPATPSNMRVTGVSNNTSYFVYVVWTDNSNNETGFEIYQSINSTNNWQLIKTPIAYCNNYGINIGSNPILGTYYYKIRTMNGSLASDFSNITSGVVN